MSEKPHFDESVTLEDLRKRIETFAKERDWDQVVDFSSSSHLVSYSSQSLTCHGIGIWKTVNCRWEKSEKCAKLCSGRERWNQESPN